ncbi:MAG TPA: hypothetical protein VMW50_08210 [Dehalococcoidia bacterium]|nr:hypothetical protein [Dehalococcoidia bacterium]
MGAITDKTQKAFEEYRKTGDLASFAFAIADLSFFTVKNQQHRDILNRAIKDNACVELRCPTCNEEGMGQFDIGDVNYPNPGQIVYEHICLSCGERFDEVYKRLDVCKPE